MKCILQGQKVSGLPDGGIAGQILEKTDTGTQWTDKPSGGISQSQADARYLQLSGGTMPDNSTGIKFPMNLNNPFAYSGDGENYFSGIYFTAR